MFAELPIRAEKYVNLVRDYRHSNKERVSTDPRVEQVVNHPPEVLHDVKNPDWGEMRRHFVDSINATGTKLDLDYSNNKEIWKKLPWQPEEKIDPIDLLGSLLVLGPKTGKSADYFPAKQTRELSERLIEKSKNEGNALTVPEIFTESLDYLSEQYPETTNPLAAAILAHSVTRKNGRNSDELNKVSIENMLDWAQNRVAQFNEKQIKAKPNAPGNTYHYFGSWIAGAVAVIYKDCRILSPKFNETGPHVAEWIARLKELRNHISNPFDHHEVDINGLRNGKQVAGRFIKCYESNDGSGKSRNSVEELVMQLEQLNIPD